ncbi:MAG: hypothetical protein HY858_02280 [Candidatus Solibacter usitatus]|nr:hypothetical protein [Candidatus Solibacter usitatus]
MNSTTVATAVVSIVAASLVWWRRVRRLTRLRQTVAHINALSEEILSAHSAPEIVDQIAKALPELPPLASASILLTDPESSELVLAAGPAGGRDVALRCHRSRAVASTDQEICLPMSALGSHAGVLRLSALEPLRPQEDEIGALRHLANQVAIALRLLDQRSLREQILRSEKVGAAGQLISSIAAELKPPLERIAATGLESVARDTEIALRTLDRLISFGRPDQTRIQPVDINLSLRELMDFRAQPCRLHHISPECNLLDGELFVLASRGQIEMALLSLLVHAEQSLQHSVSKVLSVSSQERAGRALLSISFPAVSVEGQSESGGGSWGLAVARGIIENHGGELQVATSPAGSRFDVDLPLTDARAAGDRPPGRQGAARPLTILLAHPDADALRPVLHMLSARGHRAVLALSGGEAVHFASRLRFDAVFASRDLPDLDWNSVSERLREHTACIGQLATPSDPAKPGTVTLHLPPEEGALDRMLLDVERTAQ